MSRASDSLPTTAYDPPSTRREPGLEGPPEEGAGGAREIPAYGAEGVGVAASHGLHVQRVLGRVRGAEAGPTLVLVAGLHGNEPAGVEGLRRVFAALAAGAGLRGEAVGLAGNLAALVDRKRYLREDLNRMWRRDRLELVRSAAEEGIALEAEEAELAALDAALSRVIAEARGPVVVLDLHTTSAGGPSFGVLEDTLANRDLAFELPAPMVLGLEEEIAGIMTHHLAERGYVTLGFEAGQHDDPASSDRAEAAAWIALEAAGVLPEGRAEVARSRRRLAAESRGLPPVAEVRHRHAIAPGDDFEMAPGFRNFERVEAGQTLAWDRHGPVTAPETGLLLMPLYQRQGDDGFFVVRRVRPVWLGLSRVLRRLHLERLLSVLPGVRRHPELSGSFLVDRRVARWAALELFHLLGFRRRGPAGERYLVMTRRLERSSDDTEGFRLD